MPVVLIAVLVLVFFVALLISERTAGRRSGDAWWGVGPFSHGNGGGFGDGGGGDSGGGGDGGGGGC